MQLYRKNKYYNKRCKCNQGHNHDSRGEAAYCNELDLMVRVGQIMKYETQKTFSLHGKDGKKISSHRVDFLLHDFDGKLTVHEFKGFATEVWKLKKALFEHEYPEIPYIVIWNKK